MSNLSPQLQSAASSPDNAGASSSVLPTATDSGARGTAPGVEDKLARHTSEEAVISTFTALMEDIHYKDVFELLDIGPFQLTQRKTLRREFRALYIGLWRLALMRSFPDTHASIFQTFLEQDAARIKNRREAANTHERVHQYVEKLTEQGDSDFSGVSRHILSLLNFNEDNTKALTLKLALHIRRMFLYFFNNLL